MGLLEIAESNDRSGLVFDGPTHSGAESTLLSCSWFICTVCGFEWVPLATTGSALHVQYDGLIELL